MLADPMAPVIDKRRRPASRTSFDDARILKTLMGL
jgi:hypothetical protein